MVWWKNFDVKGLANDFRRISTLGSKLVRIFLIWEDFQPTPDDINLDTLKNLRGLRYSSRKSIETNCHFLHGSYERSKLSS